jgi:hypothetical protein
MKTIISIISLCLLSHISLGKCVDFSSTLSTTDLEKLNNANDQKTDIDLHISFDKKKYNTIFIQVCHTYGKRPISMQKFQLSSSGSVLLSIQVFSNSSVDQYILIKYSDKVIQAGEPFMSGLCVDSIRIANQYAKEDHFWKQGVLINYSVSIDEKILDSTQYQVSCKNSFADLVTKSKIFISREAFNGSFTISYHQTKYEFSVFTDLKSNHQNIEILIFPNSFKKIREKLGLSSFSQFEDLTDLQRQKYSKIFPEYAIIFDPLIRFSIIQMNNTDHIIIYKVSDSSGVYKIGADSCN